MTLHRPPLSAFPTRLWLFGGALLLGGGMWNMAHGQSGMYTCKDAKGNTSLPGTYTLSVTGSNAFLTQLDAENFLPQEQKDAIAAAVDANPQLKGLAGMTQVYTGTVKLPYFLASPATAGSWDKAKTQSWHGAIPSLYAIANGLKASDSEVIAGLVGAGTVSAGSMFSRCSSTRRDTR